MTSLAASYYQCQRATRQAASNFYLSFFLLPRRKRKAMCALYAFFRNTDDLVDNDWSLDAKRAALDNWRSDLKQALKSTGKGIFPALVDAVSRYRIPQTVLLDSIEGAQMDLDRHRYETFDELTEYIDRVAVTVGIACLHVWEFSNERALVVARDCGTAFQLTNMLRDVAEDHAAGRCYLPQDELKRFGIDQHSLFDRAHHRANGEFVAFQVQRARQYFHRAAELETMLTREGRRSFRVMFGVYQALLEKIATNGGNLTGPRIRLTPTEKATVVGSAILGRRVRQNPQLEAFPRDEPRVDSTNAIRHQGQVGTNRMSR